MIIRKGSGLAAMLDLPAQTHRISNFVWMYLAQCNAASDLLSYSDFPERRCCEVLEGEPYYLRHVQDALRLRWIPDRDLGWLTNDERQATWLQHWVKAAMEKKRSETGATSFSLHSDKIPHHLNWWNRSNALIDYWAESFSGDLGQVINAVKVMESDWRRQIESDRLLGWLDNEDGENCRGRFWWRLLEYHPSISRETPVPNSHNALLVELDRLKPDLKDWGKFVTNAKRSYNQQQRRAKDDGRRQRNFVLREKTISKLEKLARDHGFTQTEVIEVLIQGEALNSVHIAERLRRISAFTAEW